MNRTIRLTVFALALWPALAFAQTQPASAQYPEWDRLTPAQRDALIAPLRDRWNSNPDERARMLERAQRWKAMPPGLRDRARHGAQRWEDMSPAQRDQARALFHAMRDLDKDGRDAFLAKWRQMTPQQRADWTKAHPAPEHDHPRD